MLSLGGESKNYQLTGVTAGTQFADWLWGAYGPLTNAWKAQGGVRPLDRGRVKAFVPRLSLADF